MLSGSTLVCKCWILSVDMRALASIDSYVVQFISSVSFSLAMITFVLYMKLIFQWCTESVQSVYSVQGIYILDDQSLV